MTNSSLSNGRTTPQSRRPESPNRRSMPASFSAGLPITPDLIAQKVNQIGGEARRLVQKFATFAVTPPERGQDATLFRVPVATQDAVSRCEACSPRFFTKRGQIALEQTSADLIEVEKFVAKGLDLAPSVFKTTGRERIVQAGKDASELANLLKSVKFQGESARPRTTGRPQQIDADGAVPVNLVVTAEYHVQGFGPIQAIVEAISREVGMNRSVPVGHFRAMAREQAHRMAVTENPPLQILVPVFKTGNSPEAVAQVIVAVDPNHFGGRLQILKQVGEYLASAGATVKSGSFTPVEGTDQSIWSVKLDQAVMVTIVTGSKIDSNGSASALISQTAKAFELMAKFESTLETVASTEEQMA